MSPEHIGECLKLTEAFRRLPRGHRRKEDSLGIKDILLHAVPHALSVIGTGSCDQHTRVPLSHAQGIR